MKGSCEVVTYDIKLSWTEHVPILNNRHIVIKCGDNLESLYQVSIEAETM